MKTDRTARPTRATASDRIRLSRPIPTRKASAWPRRVLIVLAIFAVATLLDATRAPACKVAGDSIPYYCAE